MIYWMRKLTLERIKPHQLVTNKFLPRLLRSAFLNHRDQSRWDENNCDWTKKYHNFCSSFIYQQDLFTSGFKVFGTGKSRSMLHQSLVMEYSKNYLRFYFDIVYVVFFDQDMLDILSYMLFYWSVDQIKQIETSFENLLESSPFWKKSSFKVSTISHFYFISLFYILYLYITYTQTTTFTVNDNKQRITKQRVAGRPLVFL